MYDRTYKTGTSRGIVDEKHRRAMGSARWLFDWCTSRQTSVTAGNWGVVLYGKPILYDQISRDTKFPVRTLQRWMSRLIGKRYLRTRRTSRGLIIFIRDQKKFKAGERIISTDSLKTDTPEVADHESPIVADHHARSGGSLTKNSSATPKKISALPEKVAVPSLRSSLDLNVFKNESTPSPFEQEAQRQKKALRARGWIQ